MKCRQCGKTIGEKKVRFVLAILDDPVLCSEECVDAYIKQNQDEVNAYVKDCLTTKEVPR